MTKGANGVWTVTVGPLAPDIYTYAFNVDGVAALDPQNTNTKLGYGIFGTCQRRRGAWRRPAVLRREAGAARRGPHPAV